MNNLIKFPNCTVMDYRKKCFFANKGVEIITEKGIKDKYPCIVLYEEETGIPINYTGLERYLCNLQESELLNWNTLKKKAYAVCNFLNYILKNTNINTLPECTIDLIRDYFELMKKKDGTEYDSYTWDENKGYIIDFLYLYHESNDNHINFMYDRKWLKKYEFVRDENNKKICVEIRAKLGLKRPQKTHKKNRVLIYEYLDLLLFEAEKYEPMLVLAIALQAYAGLREGEIVNLTCGRVKKVPGSFNSLKTIDIELFEKAPFFQNWNKKTDPGSIKKPREQKVYDTFLKKVNKLYDQHIALLESKGFSTDIDAPLFVNKQGNPMTVQTYSERIKKLFYERFLPALEMYCERQGTYADNAAYIDAYKMEYPGAHMFRHWFTMYLLTKTSLEKAEIATWRGDGNENSMNDYIHENSELIDIYRESSFAFQKKLLEDMNAF